MKNMSEKLIASIKKKRGKKTLFAVAAILMLTFSALLSVMPSGSAATRQEQTTAFVSLIPNPVGVDQPVHIRVFLEPFPPTANEFFHNFRVTITKPDGTTQSKGPFTSDPNAAYDFSFVPTAVGNYTFKFTYPGETLVNGTVEFLPSEAEASLVVQQEQIPQWPDAPLPTGYWTRPISAEFRSWFSIAGNWLQQGYAANGRMYGDSVGFNPYTQAPRAPHIMWVKDAGSGGLIGGEYGSENYYTGLQYDSKVSPPIVMNGRLYYRLFHSSSGSAGRYPGFVCVDLRTGAEYWRNTTGNIDIGQTYVSMGYNGQGARSFLWDYSSTTWSVYDAWSGTLFWTFVNATASPSKILYGPNGDIYAYFATGTAANRKLNMWNSSLLWEKLGWYSGGTLRSDRPGAFNWTLGNQWNVTVPNVSSWGFSAPSVYTADPSSNVVVLAGTPPESPNIGRQVLIGYDALTGEQLWIQNRTWLGTLNNRFAVGEGLLIQMNMATLQRSAIELRTGADLWLSDPTVPPWGQYTGYGINTNYGLSFQGAYDGYLVALNLTTGKQEWKYFIGNSGLETPYGTWPVFNGPTVGGYIVFGGYSEHTPSTPLFRGGKLFALDAMTGKELWTINEWLSLRALVDGYLVTVNMYDGRIFVIGKGPTATTVSAPQTVVPKGASVMITGTVTDQSPGKPGTPAISDGSMSEWMEYLYMQKPFPANATGVPVKLTAVGPNGESTEIGGTTTDVGGSYGIIWTPPAEGKYTIMTTFEGSDSYGSSYATTYLGVGPAAASPAPTATPTPTPTITPAPTEASSASPSPPPTPPGTGGPTETYIAVAAILIIVVVAAAAVILRRRR